VAITKSVNENLMLRQTDPDSAAILIPAKSIKLDQLTTDVRYGLIPLGAVFPITPHMVGSWQPGASGIVKSGFIRCDGAGIPAATIENGIKVQGTTPDLTGSIYLRGSTVSGTTGSANTRTINTPQLPPHTHPVVLGVNNVPHTHPLGTQSSTVGTHSHVSSVGAVNVPHSHPGTYTAYANAPHVHTVSSFDAGNMPHSHPHTITSSNAPHRHTGSDVSSNAPHSHTHYTFGYNSAAGTGGNRDHDYPVGTGNANNYPQGVSMTSANAPHRHPHGSAGAVNWPHSHPITIFSTNVPHRHSISAPTNNTPHTHGIASLTAQNAPHSHTVAITAANAPHTHPVTVGTTNVPHSHPGSTIGNTGSSDTVSVEPQYVDVIYMMRVR
jgi:hypothetical protein